MSLWKKDSLELCQILLSAQVNWVYRSLDGSIWSEQQQVVTIKHSRSPLPGRWFMGRSEVFVWVLCSLECLAPNGPCGGQKAARGVDLWQLNLIGCFQSQDCGLAGGCGWEVAACILLLLLQLSAICNLKFLSFFPSLCEAMAWAGCMLPSTTSL